MSKITIKDIAQKAGVSLATVSRVLNGNAHVDPLLSERVLTAARALNYTGPVLHGQNSVRRIALIIPALENTYYSSIADGVIDRARENGQEVIVMNTRADSEIEEKCFRQIIFSGVDGVIFSGTTSDNPLTHYPGLEHIPMVIAARRLVSPGVPHVYQDNVAAGYIATKYMLRLRRRHIALMVNFWGDNIRDYETFVREYNSPAQGACTAFDRYTGYCRALEEEGLSVDPNLIAFGGFSHESGYQGAHALLTGMHEFDGILVTNDRCATGVLRLFREQGIGVPEEVSLICFNGGLISHVVTPELTIVEQNNYELGVQAAARLNDLMEGRPAEDVRLDVSLSIRGSTALSS